MRLSRIAPALCVTLASAAVSQAALVMNSANTPVVFTFDADVPGVFVAAAGGGLASNGSIGETDCWAMNTQYNTNRQGGFFSTAASASNEWSGGSPFPFAANYNGDADTEDYLNINETVNIQRTSESGLPTRVLKLATANNWGTQAFYLRIQNNTGATVTSWNLTGDLFTADSDGSLGTESIGYAVDNGTSPGAMTFTNITSRMGVNTGGMYAYQALAGLNETVSASVANGDYMVLAFRDSGGNRSSFAVDNLTITAVVPEPASAALLAMSLVGLARRRRKA